MTTIIKNATPHAVMIYGENNEVLKTFEPTGVVPRCTVTRKQIGEIDGIPLNTSVFGQVEGLPDPEEGVVWIVSRVVAEAAKERGDLLVTDDAVRDDQGRIIGCRALAKV